MRQPMPPGDARAIVSRAEPRPEAEVYTWTLHDRMPAIPIPLANPDPDILLDLAPAFETANRRGRYARVLRYDAACPFLIDAEGLARIEAILKQGGV